MMGVLTFATIVLFVMMRTDLAISRRESVVLLLLYAVFVVWISLESLGYVDLIPSLPPDVSEAA
jgi:cation:H+ antiporter